MSESKSPPTRRVVEVLTALAEAPTGGRTSAEVARQCGITTSTCALLLAELEAQGWVGRTDDRRYRLGSGLFGIVDGLRRQYPLLDRGRDALNYLHDRLDAACSLSKIGTRHLTTIDVVGHDTSVEHAVGQRFPIDPPFGLVAMAWRVDEVVDDWLRAVRPRLTSVDIANQQQVLADIRARRYGAWRFDDAHSSLHERISNVLGSLEPSETVNRRLTTLLTLVTLKSVTDTLESDLATAEFVVLPIFGTSGQPEYQIEIRLGGTPQVSLPELDEVLREVQDRLTPTT